MTLRGSVASFPLETIVQLLAATAKTGQLEVRTSGESGTLGFAEGRLVSAVSGDDGGDPALGAVFALSDGDFEFVPWGEPPDGNLTGDLNQILDRAVVQRDKIVADRTLIADDRVRFRLSDRAAAAGEVRLSAEQWRALLAVNGERDLPGIAQQLKLGRLATLAMLADLVRAEIVEVMEAPPDPPPPPAPGSGRSGGTGGTDSPSGTGPPDPRKWGEPRAEATDIPPAATIAPASPVWEELSAREAPVWQQPDMPVTPPAEPLKPSWYLPTSSWEASSEPAAAPSSWDSPAEATPNRQAPAAPAETERDWGLPPREWEEPATSPTPARTEPAGAEAVRSDDELIGDPAIDERLSALSGMFEAPAAPPSGWPPEEPHAPAFSGAAPVVDPLTEAPAAEEQKKKGGLFSGLFKKEEAQARVERPTMVGLIAQTGTRVTKLAAFANALLDEFNNGQYGKGRLDDRIANLLMRVDEQADPIDRPLPIVDDRIDVSTLERASMSERQVAPYLALLISQIYEDAEHAFGREKAKRGFKTVQAAVIGDPAALGTDLRLPRV